MVIEKIKPDDISFENLMAQIKEGTIKIPDFQRDFVWERNQIVNLLDSVYNHYPIGSFLFWESTERICSYRNIGNIELKPAPKGKMINYVLDGQQRITSLFASLEEAEIKVKINGKLKKKKLQIYFDLDTKEFATYKDDEEEIKKYKKYKSIWLFSSKGNYTDNIVEVLKYIDINSPSDENLKTWFIEKFNASEVAAKAYVILLRRMGLTEHSEKGLALSYLAREYAETKDTGLIIKLLIRNIVLFQEILLQIIEHNEVDAEQLREYANKNFDIDWQSTEQIIYRLKWLWKLGYGKYSKDKFILDSKYAKILKELIEQEVQIQSDEPQEEDNELKLISIKDIVDTDRMFEIHAKLTKSRKNTFSDVHKKFKAYKFSVIYVKEQPISTVCQIFERINNSGTILNVVDLMVAKTWSNTFNLKEELYGFQEQLKKNKFNDIADITILQCLSTHIQGNCKRKDILKLNRKQLEDIWDKSTDAIKRSVDFFRKNLKITNSKILPYGSMIVPISYFYYKLGNKDETIHQRKILIEWFWRAAISSRFDSAVEGRIAEDVKRLDNLIRGKEISFNYLIPQITEERVIGQSYSLRSAFCKTIMCLFANQRPKHLQNNAPVDFDSFSRFNVVEYHHIFPQNYLKKKQPENYDSKDSIANIAFVPSGANKKYRDNAPGDYIKDLNNPLIKDALKSHLIPDYEKSGLLENDFNTFLLYRTKAILKRIKAYVGEFTSVEKGMLDEEEKEIDKFENTIRKLIHEELSKKNKDYWNEEIQKDFTLRVEDRITQWLTKHPHEKREDINPIDFCLIMDYYRIIKQKWEIFRPTFKSRTEVEKHLLHINEMRNAIKHSRKLDLATKKLAEASLIWFEQIFEGE